MSIMLEILLFSKYNYKTLSMAMSVCWLLVNNHDNYLMDCCDFGANIYCAEKMNPADVGDPLTAVPKSSTFTLKCKITLLTSLITH